MEVKITASASTLEAWREDEFASWEDHGQPAEGTHPYVLLGRAKTRIVVRSREELESLLASAEHHGGNSWDDRYAYRAAVGRIAGRLREHA